MPAFVSPIQHPETWTLARLITLMTPPAGLRYAGYRLPGVRATHAGGSVLVPATGILRRVAFGNAVAVEVQVNPFPIRRVASAISGGLPTFYLVFDDAIGLTFTDGQ